MESGDAVWTVGAFHDAGTDLLVAMYEDTVLVEVNGTA